ncbi:hypothetical protein [Chromatium okenii]|uniref:Uncharacterized protein n=1 Tax=Chromatium okenii TaxID=61644 RepID=A0A2S7XS06_9GAMM|nr:hypothetical protein [Chromatium okenii]MBV5311062.1 hypothetical protein [Chromatium okenii]PQJ96333.1 hypothetical protein CXB77_11395 [Chromatium okenii]
MPIPLLIWGAVAGATALAAAFAVKKINEDSESSSSSSDEECRRLERQAKEERAQKERDLIILPQVNKELTGLYEEHISGTNPIQVSSFDKLREAFKTNPQNNPILRQLQQQMNESKDAIKGRQEILLLEQELNALRMARQAVAGLTAD